MPRTIQDHFVARLGKLGVEDPWVQRFVKDISFLFESNPSMECWELNNRLHLLGWNDVEVDVSLMELARASVGR